MDKNQTTENRIKDVARTIFHEKGYDGARTREIADAAGINIALLNYYFRSKENLFNIIMLESIQDIFQLLGGVVNNTDTSLMQKIEQIVDRYANTLIVNPHLPLFVLSEIRNNPERFVLKVGIPENMLLESYFFKQMQAQIDKEQLETTAFQLFINVVSMTVLPIIANPLIKHLNMMDESVYIRFVEDRKKMIPLWMKSILKIQD